MLAGSLTLGSCSLEGSQTATATADHAAEVASARAALYPLMLAYCGLYPPCPNVFAYLDPAKCAADVDSQWFSRFYAQGLLAIGKGHASLDTDWLEPCRQKITADHCAYVQWFASDPMECRQLFVGKLHNGERCRVDAECASRRCGAASGSSNACKVCYAGSTQGAACSADPDCADGLQCRGSTCVAVPTAHPSLGQPCDRREDCFPQGYCGPAQVGKGSTCLPPAGVGEVCEPSHLPCQPGAYCDGAKSPTCQPQLAPGAPCIGGKDTSAASYDCPTNHWCVPAEMPLPATSTVFTGTCQPRGTPGQLCIGDRGCFVGDLVCQTAADGRPRCLPGPFLGMPCDPTFSMIWAGGTATCRPSLACDSATNRCVPLPGAGERCIDHACQPDLVCFTDSPTVRTGTCRAPGKLGEACQWLDQGTNFGGSTWDTCDWDFVCNHATHKCQARDCP
ncbi:MAG: hypothetical protein HY902_16090 [Deltaproteobacteria bacterium]|nr:hypothetical protein [Deltaproteobacteria bacterium]